MHGRRWRTETRVAAASHPAVVALPSRENNLATSCHVNLDADQPKTKLEWPPGGARTREAGRPAAVPHVRGEGGRRRDEGGRGDDCRTTLPGAERGADRGRAIAEPPIERLPARLGLPGLGEAGLACAVAGLIEPRGARPSQTRPPPAAFVEPSGGRPLIVCGLGALPVACCWHRIAACRWRSLRLDSAAGARHGASCAAWVWWPSCSSSRRSASARRHASSAETALNFVRVSPSARRRHSRTCV